MELYISPVLQLFRRTNRLRAECLAYKAAQDALNGWDPTWLYILLQPITATSQWIFNRDCINYWKTCVCEIGGLWKETNQIKRL